MKLIDKDALVAEIERLENKNCKNSNDFNLGAATYLGMLKQFVNTHEVKYLQEEPASEDFEKEMDNYIPTVFSKDMDSGEPRFTTWFRALRKTARHFANWQKNKMMEDAVDGVVAASAGGDGWVNIATGFVKSEDVNVKFGDKIKIIVVKED